jgi:hypothetical protein
MNDRSFQIYIDNNYEYKNTSLISFLSIQRPKSFSSYSNSDSTQSTIYMCINDVNIPPTFTDNKIFSWDFEIIRENIRNIIIPESEQEQLLMRLESTFAYNSLRAISFYNGLTPDQLDSSVFTLDLAIRFKVIVVEKPNPINDIGKKPPVLNANEMYYTSTAKENY